MDCRSDFRRANRKKRVVAEGTLEALRAWNDANELEQCPREESWVELYQYLGDKETQDRIREQNKNNHHCRWLERDANACECLPEGVEGEHNGQVIKPGMACPHNVYVQKHSVFENRDAVAGTIERLLRLVGSADAGLLNEKEMDSMSVTELLVSKSELNRQQNTREKRAAEKAHLEAQVNKEKSNLRPTAMGEGTQK